MIEEGFNAAVVPFTRSIITDGAKLMDLLHHRDENSNAPRPDLILLDLDVVKKCATIISIEGCTSEYGIEKFVLTRLMLMSGEFSSMSLLPCSGQMILLMLSVSYPPSNYYGSS